MPIGSFFAEDGLMKLERGPDREPYAPSFPPTCDNDNGVLFLAEWLYLAMPTQDPETRGHWWNVFRETCRTLSIREGSLIVQRGIYYRNPGRSRDLEAFDNYVGIVAGHILFGELDAAINICDFGDKNGYFFDTRAPGSMADLASWRQGAEIAFYQLCALRRPQLWNFVWLCLGVFFTAFMDVERNSNEWWTCWLRLRALDLLEGNTRTLLPRWHNLLSLAKDFWLWQLKRKTQGRGMERLAEIYFHNPHHPIRTASRGVFY
jgi:hypothetical protein